MPHADDKVTTADLWDDFDAWAKEKRIMEKIGKQKFFKWLQSLDGVNRPGNGRIFTGLRLKTVTEQMAVHLHNMSWGDDRAPIRVVQFQFRGMFSVAVGVKDAPREGPSKRGRK